MKNVLKSLSEARSIISKTPMKKKGRNTYSNYDYFTPDQVHTLVEEACQKTGLLTIFELKKDELGYYGKLTITHVDSGEEKCLEFRTDIPDIKATNTSQKLGGAITYSERYAKQSAFGIIDNNLDFDNLDNRDKKPTPQATLKPTSQAKKKLDVWKGKRNAFINQVKKGADDFNKTGLPPKETAGLISKAYNEYKINIEEIGKALIDAGVNVKLEASGDTIVYGK